MLWRARRDLNPRPLPDRALIRLALQVKSFSLLEPAALPGGAARPDPEWSGLRAQGTRREPASPGFLIKIVGPPDALIINSHKLRRLTLGDCSCPNSLTVTQAFRGSVRTQPSRIVSAVDTR